jgi:hypothetical protein
MHENRETSKSASARKGARPVCEGAKPQGRRARSRGVGPRHTIDEPDEQRRAIFGGAWGEKGAGQGEHRFVQHLPDTVRGFECIKDGAVYAEPRSASSLQGGSRMRESRSYGSVRGGGDQRWSSLPQQLTFNLHVEESLQTIKFRSMIRCR